MNGKVALVSTHRIGLFTNFNNTLSGHGPDSFGSDINNVGDLTIGTNRSSRSAATVGGTIVPLFIYQSSCHTLYRGFAIRGRVIQELTIKTTVIVFSVYLLACLSLTAQAQLAPQVNPGSITGPATELLTRPDKDKQLYINPTVDGIKAAAGESDDTTVVFGLNINKPDTYGSTFFRSQSMWGIGLFGADFRLFNLHSPSIA
jgi:hypothetical protein